MPSFASGLDSFLLSILQFYAALHRIGISQEKWELVMSYVHHHYTSKELSQAYYQAKQEGRLKSVKLLVGGDFYIRNSDFIGIKYLTPGIMLEAEVYDDIICQVWLSPTECEFVFIGELEFI